VRKCRPRFGASSSRPSPQPEAAVDAASSLPADALEVGRIIEAWGLKGWVRVQPYSLPPLALLKSRSWHLLPPEAAARGSAPSARTTFPSTLEIAEIREHGEGLVARSASIPDRTAAEAMRGARILIARADFPQPADDEFYWADLIGLDVVNREGSTLGRVAGLLDTGPHSVLRVQDDSAPAEQERLIPFVSAYVDHVDFQKRVILVDWGSDY